MCARRRCNHWGSVSSVGVLTSPPPTKAGGVTMPSPLPSSGKKQKVTPLPVVQPWSASSPL